MRKSWKVLPPRRGKGGGGKKRREEEESWKDEGPPSLCNVWLAQWRQDSQPSWSSRIISVVWDLPFHLTNPVWSCHLAFSLSMFHTSKTQTHFTPPSKYTHINASPQTHIWNTSIFRSKNTHQCSPPPTFSYPFRPPHAFSIPLQYTDFRYKIWIPLAHAQPVIIRSMLTVTSLDV